MKVVLVFVIVLLAAVTALAYGQAGSGAGLADVVTRWTEPAALLLSGGALLGIAGAVRRLPF